MSKRAVDEFVRKHTIKKQLLAEARAAVARLPKELWEELFFEMLSSVERGIVHGEKSEKGVECGCREIDIGINEGRSGEA